MTGDTSGAVSFAKRSQSLLSSLAQSEIQNSTPFQARIGIWL
jgi:hypothetical protein